MTTNTKSSFNERTTVFKPIPTTTLKTENSITIWDKYLKYAEKQEGLKVYWYMKVIIAIPCVFMVISIYAMAMLTPNYIWFVVLNMVLFFANVVAHLSEAKGTFFVPLYHTTIAILSIIPFITYLILS